MKNEQAMKTAKYIKTTPSRGMAALYELSEPVTFCHIVWGANGGETNFVIVSTIDNEIGQETFIFPADKDGQKFNMLELHGSFSGTVGSVHANRREALKRQGFYARD